MLPAIIPTQQLAGSPRTTSARAIRKRVCKACDRCRLKKGKCDGANQCSRCKTDNAICVFGERKRAKEKNYPKGYAEMLEQQQAQLVSALTEMYRQLRRASAWEGPSLDERTGQPLTYGILSALDLFDIDGKSNEVQMFENECEKRQFEMSLDNATIARRRLQVQANEKVADGCQEGPGATQSGDRDSVQSEISSSTQSLDQPNVTASLVTQSTFSRWEDYPNLQKTYVSVAQHSTLQGSPAFTNDKRPRVSEWEHALMTMNETFQAYCDESEAFGASNSLWESAPISLESHQDLLISEKAYSMPNVNDLVSLNWLSCAPDAFVWQPEMTTWAT